MIRNTPEFVIGTEGVTVKKDGTCSPTLVTVPDPPPPPDGGTRHVPSPQSTFKDDGIPEPSKVGGKMAVPCVTAWLNVTVPSNVGFVCASADKLKNSRKKVRFNHFFMVGKYPIAGPKVELFTQSPPSPMLLLTSDPHS